MNSNIEIPDIISEFGEEYFEYTKETHPCIYCRKPTHWRLKTIPDKNFYVCPDDIADIDKITTCEHCDKPYPVDMLTEVKTREEWGSRMDWEEVWCQKCIDTDAFYCDICEEYFDKNVFTYIVAHDGSVVCNYCQEGYGLCPGCNEYFPGDEMYYCEADGELYCESCYEEHCPFVTEGEIVTCSSVGDITHTTQTSFNFFKYPYTYGTELEISSPDLDIYEVSREICEDIYYDNLRFCVDQDGSLSNGFQIISPILMGDKGILALKNLLKKIGEFSLDSTCGYHLHIGRTSSLGPKLDWFDLAKIYTLFYIIEPSILAMLPISRRSNRYATPIIKYYVPNVFHEKADLIATFYEKPKGEIEKGYMAIKEEKYLTQRYKGVNLHAFYMKSKSGERHETIEIRYHTGTTNYRKVVNWIRIILALVNYALTTSYSTLVKLSNDANTRTHRDNIKSNLPKLSHVSVNYFNNIFLKIIEEQDLKFIDQKWAKNENLGLIRDYVLERQELFRRD